ncbi:unnamed protein product, partial [Ectocarpus sp. 12 AP-2014]
LELGQRQRGRAAVAKPAYTNTGTMKKRARSGVPLLVVRSAEVRKTYRAWFLSMSLAALLLCSVPLFSAVGVTASTAAGAKGASSRHNNNWAVLVCTSRFWFNYRHVANTLSVYHTVRRLGIPDSNIVLMLADDMPCNARNPFPGGVYNSKDHELNLYEGDVEVDYRGEEVSVESFLRLLTGRTLPGTPPSKVIPVQEARPHLSHMSPPVCAILIHVFSLYTRPSIPTNHLQSHHATSWLWSSLSIYPFCLCCAALLFVAAPSPVCLWPLLPSRSIPLDNISCEHPVQTLATDEHSNVLIYMNGHGGDQFLKFHDMEEVSSHDLGGALREMELKKRYHRVLFMVDTCQAMTLFEEIDSKDVICIGSSVRGENSYARGSDATIGLSLMDRFTSAMLDFFQAAITKGEDVTANRVRGFSSGNSAPLNLRDDVTLGALMHSIRPKSLLSSPTVELKGWTGPPLNKHGVGFASAVAMLRARTR